MSSDSYLIAHKVRGEPAFDIAQELYIDALGEMNWIIPTSGHIAHPVWTCELSTVNFTDVNLENLIYIYKDKLDLVPDHYPLNSQKTHGIDLAARLGLLKPKPEITRRI